MNEPTSLASWTRALRKQLDAIGVDSAALCRQAGLDPLRVEESNAQLPLSATNALWQLAVQASGDPAIGLRVARFVSPSTFHSLGYALIASENLREVFERIVRYHQASDALTPTLARENGRYVLRLQATDSLPAPAAEAIDAFAAIYVRTCRNRLGPDYAPLAVRLTRARPQDPKPWLTVFRSPIHFNAEEDSLEFACADFDCHLDDASPQGASPEMLQPLTWERRVGDAIEHCLPQGVPSADEVAEVLRLSLRNLQRHLADEGCRFDALLDQCQQNLALQYLNDLDLPLSEIGHRLGFADAGTFIRAFKRWTGISPGQYRNNLA